MARRVVELEVPPLRAHGHAQRTGRQVEQVAGDNARDCRLVIGGGARVRLCQQVQKCGRRVAGQERRVERVVGRRAVQPLCRQRLRIARRILEDLQRRVFAFRVGVRRIQRPREVGQDRQRSEIPLQAGRCVEVVDVHFLRRGEQRNGLHRRNSAERAFPGRAVRVVVERRTADGREELAPAFLAVFAPRVERLRGPVDVAERDVGTAVKAEAIDGRDRVGVLVDVAIPHVFIIGAGTVGVRRVAPQAIARDGALLHAIRRRDVDLVREEVGEDVDLRVTAGRSRVDRPVLAIEALAGDRVIDQVLRATEILAVLVQQRIARFVFSGQHQRAAEGQVSAPRAVDLQGVAAALFGGVVLRCQLWPVDRVARDDVGHARHSVRAVDRRSAVLQDFDAADNGVGDHVEVERSDLAAHAGGAGTLAVQQDQRALGAEAAERDRVDARAAFNHEAAELVVELHRAGRHGRALQDLARVHEAFQRGLFRRDDLDRRRRGERIARDARARDHDALRVFRRRFRRLDGLGGRLGGGVGLLGERRGASCEHDPEGCGTAKASGELTAVHEVSPGIFALDDPLRPMLLVGANAVHAVVAEL